MSALSLHEDAQLSFSTIDSLPVAKYRLTMLSKWPMARLTDFFQSVEGQAEVKEVFQQAAASAAAAGEFEKLQIGVVGFGKLVLATWAFVSAAEDSSEAGYKSLMDALKAREDLIEFFAAQLHALAVAMTAAAASGDAQRRPVLEACCEVLADALDVHLRQVLSNSSDGNSATVLIRAVLEGLSVPVDGRPGDHPVARLVAAWTGGYFFARFLSRLLAALAYEQWRLGASPIASLDCPSSGHALFGLATGLTHGAAGTIREASDAEDETALSRVGASSVPRPTGVAALAEAWLRGPLRRQMDAVRARAGEDEGRGQGCREAASAALAAIHDALDLCGACPVLPAAAVAEVSPCSVGAAACSAVDQPTRASRCARTGSGQPCAFLAQRHAGISPAAVEVAAPITTWRYYRRQAPSCWRWPCALRRPSRAQARATRGHCWHRPGTRPRCGRTSCKAACAWARPAAQLRPRASQPTSACSSCKTQKTARVAARVVARVAVRPTLVLVVAQALPSMPPRRVSGLSLKTRPPRRCCS